MRQQQVEAYARLKPVDNSQRIDEEETLVYKTV